LKNLLLDDSEVVFVMRGRGNNLLAPTAKLLYSFKAMEKSFQERGYNSVEAHNRAWVAINYDRQFSMVFWGNERAQARLREIVERAEKQDVYLVCYEKEPKMCHRHLLMKFAEQLKGGTHGHTEGEGSAGESVGLV